MKPKLFIGSSAEQLDIAYAVQENLEHDVEATVWTQGIFELSKTTIESLVDAIEETDFGLFIFAPDDVSMIRSDEMATVRDNVIFELGLFIGRLGRERAFIITPSNSSDLRMPTDLLGITPANYQPDRTDGNLVAALGPACNRVQRSVRKFGKKSPSEAGTNTDIDEKTGLIEDDNDCISLIESMMGARPSGENTRAIKYAEVDQKLGLVPGSARKHIEAAALRWNYRPRRKGKDTITFE
ncbi:TIR domain-containing protein [Pseudahrensia aquimaris]|uniref:TIR domain-containing protein n=1 Tax=Pseudahrensia aquimaris TaxID=744461 RepID=A0ABW3FHZ1_9HYPH